MVDAAVDEQQIRLFPEARVARLVVDKPPLHHLAHGGIVILIGQPLQLEPLVVAFLRLAVHKNYHAGYNVRAGDVGNIEGLDSLRSLHVQHFAEKGQSRADPLFPAGEPLGFLKGILTGKLHQADIVPSLWYLKLWQAAALLGQELGDHVPILNFKGQENPLGHQSPAEIILLQEAGNRLFLLIRPLEDFVILVQKIPSGEMEHRKAGLGFRLPVANHIRIRQRARGDKLLLT